MTQHTKVPPPTASLVTDSCHEWTDDERMAERVSKGPHADSSPVYEVYLGS